MRGRHFSGSTVDDMNHQIVPVLCKNTSPLIICVAKNNASLSTSIPESAVQEKYRDWDVCILKPIILSGN